MKKIVIIDGGPRKNMNTAAMIGAFSDGAKSVGEAIEVKRIRLYDLDYKGCYSCLACKLKDSKFRDVCAYKDGLTETLRETAYADGVVFASPIYYSRVTGQMESFIERLTFPWLSYNDYSLTPPKRIPAAVIYTMNDPTAERRSLQSLEILLGGFYGEKPERVAACNTYQVHNYDLYDMKSFSTEKKERWRAEHWEQDLRNAYEAGRRMAEKILGIN